MIKAPLILLGAPRSGTTLLFRALSQHRELWHLVAESHRILEGPWHPKRFSRFSNRPPENYQLTEATRVGLRADFYRGAVNYASAQSWKLRADFYRGPGQRYLNRAVAEGIGRYSRGRKPASIRLLEKTPKNAVRAKWMNALFPKARFVRLVREAVPNISSLYYGWKANDTLGKGRRGRYSKSGYPIMTQLGLRDFGGSHWSFVLPPHWEGLRGGELLDVCAFQYFSSNYWMERDLTALLPERCLNIAYEDLIQQPLATVERILDFAGLSPAAYDYRYLKSLPRINSVTVSEAEKKQTFLEIERKLKTFALDTFFQTAEARK